RSRRLIPYALSSIPQGESGIDGVARIRPKAASGGMGANHGYSCARHPRSRVRFAYPGYAGAPRPVAPAEPEPLTPRSPQRERGIEGRSPDKAEGRIRGNWAPITAARARDILVPGCASLTRATQVHRDRWRLQNPNPSPLDPPTGEGNRGA